MRLRGAAWGWFRLGQWHRLRCRGALTPLTVLHVRLERGGKPICFVLTSGERHEQAALPTLLERGAVRRPERRRPRRRPDRLAGDKGHSSQKLAYHHHAFLTTTPS